MQGRSTIVDIGGIPVALRTSHAGLVEMLEDRFAGFMAPESSPAFRFDVTVVAEHDADPDADLRVELADGRWMLQRGDFSAQWDPSTREGWIRQTLNPYAIDSILRIVHTLVLAAEGGFLLHASSAIRDGRAVLFTGPSGAGKTTIARLAPDDVTLLTDEISYVRRTADGYRAYGTPFAGELGESGEQTSAPVTALFSLDRGDHNTRERLGEMRCVRTLMRNILFFDNDPSLTRHLLDTACHFAGQVPAYRLAFAPDARVWDTLP